MLQIHHKGDRKLYHRVKAYELAKTEDQLIREFGVELNQLLELERRLKLREEEHSIKFVDELDEMIEAKDQSWLGTKARLTLWQSIERDFAIGPILYEQHSDSKEVTSDE